jgi:hypothetical protein
MAELKQATDGSLVVFEGQQGVEYARFGGPKPVGAPGAGGSIPDFRPGSKIKLGPYAGVVATTGGAIGAWTNNLGYDVIVTGAWFDVTTVSTGAANLTVGQTATSVTTASANLIAAVSVAALGVKPGGLSVKVKAGEFVTLTGSADTTGLVGSLYLEYMPA